MADSPDPAAHGRPTFSAAEEHGFAMNKREFIAMMAAMMALNALAIDSMLPALPDIVRDLGVTNPNDRQLIVAAYLFMNGVGALFMGPLADRFGRRPILLGAIAVYVLLALGCALAGEFNLLIAMRAVQGFAAAATSVLVVAVIRDRYSGDRMASLMSTIFIVFLGVPVIAPSVGQLILYVADWQAIFYLLAGLGLAVGLWVGLRLPETLRPADATPIRASTLAASWSRVATDRLGLGYILCSAITIGALFGFINSGQQIFAEVFDAAAIFPYAFACVAGTMALANFFNSRIVERFGARRVSHLALLAYIALSVAQVGAVLLFEGKEPLWLFLGLLAVNMSMVGFTGANFGSIAMEPFGHIAGAASAFQTFLRTAGGAAIGFAIGQMYDGTTLPLALGFLVAGLLALVILLWAEQGRLFTRPRRTGREPRPPR